jgi:hypothetical protein
MTCDIVVTPKVAEIVSPALRSARLLQLRQAETTGGGPPTVWRVGVTRMKTCRRTRTHRDQGLATHADDREELLG